MVRSNFPIPSGSLTHYLAELHRFPLLSKGEEFELARRYHDTHDRTAAHRLITANLRFVVKIAYEYSTYGAKMADLIQEGNLGLMQALKKFNPYRGFRFITYAVWWIRATIQNFILQNWSLVKIGTTQAQRKLFYKLGQAKRALRIFERVSSDREEKALAKRLQVRPQDIKEMDMRLSGRDASLETPFAESETTPLDLLPSPATQEEALDSAERQAKIRRVISEKSRALSARERYILENRILAEEPVTLADIGNRYKVSRERARQIEAGVLNKFRAALIPLHSEKSFS